MPRVPLHALTWSREQNLYELYTQGQLQQRFRPAEEAAWLAWLLLTVYVPGLLVSHVIVFWLLLRVAPSPQAERASTAF